MMFNAMRIMLTKKVLCCGNSGGFVPIARKFRDYSMTAPEELSCEMVVPIGPPVCIQQFTYKGDVEKGKEMSKEWSKLSSAIVNDYKVASYQKKIQAFVGNMTEKEVKGGGIDERVCMFLASGLPDEALAILSNAVTARPKAVKEGVIIMQRLGGAIEKKDVEATAFAHRKAQWWITIIAVTAKKGKSAPEGNNALAEEWLVKVTDELKPHLITNGVGSLSSMFGASPSLAPPKENVFGSPERVAKLQAIKAKYDPKNVFSAVENGMSGAHNITPA
mmetsp:Transcript_26453/g.67163  ORF Transcript_26453/g.67163 Transcript_26453/m.67163 type:complete len:276 (+) Transcript_26453:267-1094(+)